jgi:hypothetical protein
VHLSGSMSLLAQPVPSRYPFQFWRPVVLLSLGSCSRRSARALVNRLALVNWLAYEPGRPPGCRSGATAAASFGARSRVTTSSGNGESPRVRCGHAPPSFASGLANARILLPLATFIPTLPHARTRRPRADPDAPVLCRTLYS